MNTATGYLHELAAMFGRLEITGRDATPQPVDDAIGRVVETILAAKAGGSKILLIGNGGSAAIVSHMQNDLCKAVGVRAMVFHESPLLMALSNDHGYETVFERQIGLWAEAGDVLIAISSSGESPNILRGVGTAASRGCRVITLSGFTPTNRLRQLGDINVYVPAATYGYVELTHQVLVHCITDLSVVRAAAAL
jgi:D-sedoheptulose 7-phosphate isomerase